MGYKQVRSTLVRLLTIMVLVLIVRTAWSSNLARFKAAGASQAPVDGIENRAFELRAKIYFGARPASTKSDSAFFQPLLTEAASLSHDAQLLRHAEILVLSAYLKTAPNEYDAAVRYLERERAKNAFVAALLDVYGEGKEPVPEARRKLEEALGWSGYFLPGSNSEMGMRLAKRTAKNIAILGGVMLLLVPVGIWAFVIFLRRLKVVWKRPPVDTPNDDTLLEVFCFYLLSMVTLSWLIEHLGRIGYVVDPIKVSTFVMPLMLLLLLWGKERGRPAGEFLRTLGYVPYRLGQLLREARAGAFGYLAMLVPTASILICFALVLQHFGVEPNAGAHPIVPILIESKGTLRLAMIVFLAVAVAPVLEETMFRGAFYGWLRARFSVFGSALISGLIFASVHPQGWIGVLPLTIIGLTLALVREWRGNLLAGMVLHACVNGVTFLLVMITLG